jgi:hypothetical protein
VDDEGNEYPEDEAQWLVDSGEYHVVDDGVQGSSETARPLHPDDDIGDGITLRDVWDWTPDIDTTKWRTTCAAG